MASFDWSAVAPAWEKHATSDAKRGAEAAKADALLTRLGVTSDQRVLELGAGAGELSVRLANLVGPEGSVLASDVAAGMVDILGRTTLGLDHVTVEQIDAADTGLPDDSFDVIVFCMGLMFLAEPASATKELHRIIKPGGRVGIETWAGPEHNPWLACIGMSAMRHGVVTGPPPWEPGGVFSLASPDALRTVISAGGFVDVDVTPFDVEFRFPTFDEYFETVSALAGPLAQMLAQASPEQLQAVRETSGEMTRQYVTAEGLVLPGRALVAVAS